MQRIDNKGDYELVVTESQEDGKLSYQIINLKYGVIEAETRILPQALKFLEELSASLDMIADLKKEDFKSKPGEVVHFDKGEK